MTVEGIPASSTSFRSPTFVIPVPHFRHSGESRNPVSFDCRGKPLNAGIKVEDAGCRVEPGMTLDI